MKRNLALCVAAVALIASIAQSSPLTLGASGGPVFVAGEGASVFRHGRWMQLDAVTNSSGANAWAFRAAYADFGSQSGNVYFDSGRLYGASGSSGSTLRQTSVEAGVARRLGSGAVRPLIEGLVGASWIESVSPSSSPPGNDRRPDPTALSSRVTGHLAPAVTLGAGLEVAMDDRVGLSVSAAAHWIPTDRLNGTLLPIRIGVAWPVEPPSNDDEAVANRPGPQLRGSIGTSVLRAPARLRSEMKPSTTFAASIEQSIAPWLALSLEGEHMSQKDAVPIFHSERDQFGNLFTVVTGSSPLSATLTVATLGVRAWRPIGAVTVFARTGAGWGRTGGFGITETQTLGLYADTSGYLHPLQQQVDHGAGASANGFAYSGSAGVEARVRGPVAVFVEAGALGVQMKRDNVLVIPVRLGIVLR